MKIASRLTSFTSGFMLKLSQFPGLGFLHNYVMTARSMKSQFGDKMEDYGVFLALGQEVVDDARGAAGMTRQGKASAEDDDEGQESIYDDYQYPEETSSGHHPADDYPVSDERHSYYDDDYRAH